MAERGLLLVSGPARTFVVALGVALAVSGCSIQSLAIESLTKALSSGTDVLSSDEDPELVREALPFTLKTIEMLLAKDPDNLDLLLMACSGFTTYGYAFVELDATRIELDSYRRAEQLRQRALKLYLRARGYCLRAFDIRFPGLGSRLPTDFDAVLRKASEQEVDLLYWLAGSWGSAISLGLDRPELVADLPVVRALLERGLELSPSFDRGAFHEAMISIEAVPETMGGSLERARAHYEAALEANGGLRASTYLSWARAMASTGQNRAEFESMIDLALAVDVDAVPSDRLANILGRERALLLRDRAEELFLDDLDDLVGESEEGYETDRLDGSEDP